MSGGSDGAIIGIARAFTRWAAQNESLDARQVLAGLGHLGNFLITVANTDIDLELGHKESHAYIPPTPNPHIELLQKDSHASSTFEEYFPRQEIELLKKLRFLKAPGTLSILDITYEDSSSLIVTICDKTPAGTDYQTARNLVDSQWILTEPLRKKLYYHLFVPTRQPNLMIFDTIIRGKVALIRVLQQFMLHFVSSIKNKVLPNLGFLVEDAVDLVQILQEPLPHNALPTFKQYHPFHHFRERRCQAWRQLDFSDAVIDEFWESYQNGLCDALLGLWPSTSYLHERNESCSVRSILGCFDLNHRQPENVPELNSNIFDASFIVSNGPFRFKKTKNIHEHLSVRQNEILVFTDLQKLAGIRHHAILQTDPICMFDILTSEDRYTPPHTISIRPFLRRLHYSVQASLFLLFFQRPVHHHALGPSGGKNYRIAKELGIELGDADDIENLAKTVLGDHSTWESFLDRTTEIRLQDPFMIPLDKLSNTLTSWRPRTFWEMRYPGYGNVDMVQLYGFYFGLMIGIVGIIALILAAAQTYAGFKALQIN
jgi:hypothetical protein